MVDCNIIIDDCKCEIPGHINCTEEGPKMWRALNFHQGVILMHLQPCVILIGHVQIVRHGCLCVADSGTTHGDGDVFTLARGSDW